MSKGKKIDGNGKGGSMVVVLDMDGTMYNFDNENNVYKGSSLQRKVFENAVSFISLISGKTLDEVRDEVERCLSQNEHLSLYVSNTYGVTRDDYLQSVWNIDPEGIVQTDLRISKLLTKLREKGALLVLLTSAPQVWQKKIFQYLSLDESTFYKIYTTDQSKSKQEMMKEIKIFFEDIPVYSVGDQYETDIKPAEELGFTTRQVNGVDGTVLFIEELLGEKL